MAQMTMYDVGWLNLYLPQSIFGKLDDRHTKFMRLEYTRRSARYSRVRTERTGAGQGKVRPHREAMCILASAEVTLRDNKHC
jgi:hypothetical protein